MCTHCGQPIREASFSPEGYHYTIDGLQCVEHSADSLMELFGLIAETCGMEN